MARSIIDIWQDLLFLSDEPKYKKYFDYILTTKLQFFATNKTLLQLWKELGFKAPGKNEVEQLICMVGCNFEEDDVTSTDDENKLNYILNLCMLYIIFDRACIKMLNTAEFPLKLCSISDDCLLLPNPHRLQTTFPFNLNLDLAHNVKAVIRMSYEFDSKHESNWDAQLYTCTTENIADIAVPVRITCEVLNGPDADIYYVGKPYVVTWLMAKDYCRNSQYVKISELANDIKTWAGYIKNSAKPSFEKEIAKFERK